jgi:hypothetical protein
MYTCITSFWTIFYIRFKPFLSAIIFVIFTPCSLIFARIITIKLSFHIKFLILNFFFNFSNQSFMMMSMMSMGSFFNSFMMMSMTMMMGSFFNSRMFFVVSPWFFFEDQNLIGKFFMSHISIAFWNIISSFP